MSTLPSVVLVIGSDRYHVIEAYRAERERLAEAVRDGVGVEEVDGEDDDAVVRVLDAARTPAMFGDHRVIALRGGITAATIPRLLEYCDSPSPDVTLLLAHIKSGAGSKAFGELVRSIENQGVLIKTVAPPDRPRDLVSYVLERAGTLGVTLRADAAALLAASVGSDSGAIDGVLRQVASVASDDSIDRARLQPFVSDTPGTAPWDLTDAIDAGDASRALRALRGLHGFYSLQIQAVLVRHVRGVLATVELRPSSAKQLESELGFKPNVARKLLGHVRRTPPAAARAAHRELARADVALRGGSGLDSQAIMDVLVVRLTRLLGQRRAL